MTFWNAERTWPPLNRWCLNAEVFDERTSSSHGALWKKRFFLSNFNIDAPEHVICLWNSLTKYTYFLALLLFFGLLFLFFFVFFPLRFQHLPYSPLKNAHASLVRT